MKKGEFIGAFAPYGYCKDPENKNCLVIDSYAADIVRKIFSWKIDGFSLGAIAEKLNVRHVQSPKEYKRQMVKITIPDSIVQIHQNGRQCRSKGF